MLEWSENHPNEVLPMSIAKADFGKSSSLDDMVEHFLAEHDGNIDGLRERFAKNAKISVIDD